MKHLSKYIIESLGKFKPTLEWIIEHYDKYNKELFNNELPNSNKVSLKIERSQGRELGCQGFNVGFFISSEFMENGMYRMRAVKPGKSMSYSIRSRGRMIPIVTEENTVPVNSCLELKPFININDIYVVTEHNLEDTLIHEMIHLWVSKDGLEPKQAHGKEFKQKCNEIRKLAKAKYGIDYELTTKAKNHDEYEYDDQKKAETNSIIQKNKKRGGGAVGVYLVFNDNVLQTRYPYNKRFFFCTKSMLPSLIKQIKYYESDLTNIYISENSYEEICKIYGAFKLVNTYRFWDLKNYKKAEEILLKDAQDIFNESLNEAKKPYIKPEMFMYEIPANTNLSNIDLEDIVNTKIEDENEETNSTSENDKNMISIS